MQRISACQVKLLLASPPLKELSLVCRLNGNAVARADLYVIPKPPIPEIQKVVSTPSKNITVLIDRRSTGDMYRDNYTVEMIEHLVPSASKVRTVKLCHLQLVPVKDSSGLVCPDGQKLCVCQYEEHDDKYDRVRDINVTLVVTVQRIFGYVETSLVINLVDYIQPEPTKPLEIGEVSPHRTTVRICQSDLTQSLAYFMDLRGRPLRCHVALNKTDGQQEFMTAEFNAHATSACVAVTFSNLTAYTSYVLTTFSVGAWEGHSVSAEFITEKSVPIRPPVLDKFAFSRDPQHNALFLIWQPLSQEDQGGAKVSYDLEVWSMSGLEVNISQITDNYWWSAKASLPQGQLEARVWARNEIGRSHSFSSIKVAALSDTRPVPFQVEVSGNKVQVHLKSALKTGGKPIALHLCETYTRQGDFDTCTSYPQTIILPQNDAIVHPSGTSVMYAFYLDKTVESRSTTRQSPLLYKFEGTDMTNTIQGYVTTFARSEPRWVANKPEAFSDSAEADLTDHSGDGVSMHDHGVDDEDVSELIDQGAKITKRSAKLQRIQKVSRARRKKRSNVKRARLSKRDEREGIGTWLAGRRLLALSNESLITNIDGESTAPLGLSTVLPEVDKQGEKGTGLYRVFISEQTEDGRWLGMTPAECYFLGESDNVELIISQVTGSVLGTLQDSPIIRWRQECDSRPAQFLVDAYQVFVSGDETCRQNVSHVGEVQNRIFEPLQLPVPADWPFVCLRASHQVSGSGSFVSQPFVTGIATPLAVMEKSSNDVTAVVFAVLLPTLIVLLVFVCIWRCRKGYAKVKKGESQFHRSMFEDSGKDEVKSGLTQENAEPNWTDEQKKRSQQSGLSTTENGDSGRGTLSGRGSNSNESGGKSRSKSGTKVFADSQSLSLYHIQGRAAHVHRSERSEPVFWSETSGVTLDSSSGGDNSCRVVHDSNATSNGDGWLDESSGQFTDFETSSDPRIGFTDGRVGNVKNVTSDGAGWLDGVSDDGSVSFVESPSGGDMSDACVNFSRGGTMESFEESASFDQSRSTGTTSVSEFIDRSACRSLETDEPFVIRSDRNSGFEQQNSGGWWIDAQSSGQSSGIGNDCIELDV
ncbi:hypothetical protein EGW08_000779 [Elysia chlorotica]|uniref:Fibronectin type-III domain-containing protein n=1 Tax=Elysia chlorotica TaxID=188477 RepID=A0A433UC89_ELYCH|nr:hypothetical protein EGW08_000779 [Elysia chlorotica]